MGDTKKLIFKICCDILILLLFTVTIIIIELVADPHKVGFFCDDQSLKRPYYENRTITNSKMISYSLIVPSLTILIIELIDYFLTNKENVEKLKIFNWKAPIWLINSYRDIGYFAFGAACTLITTDMMKYSLGILRPHFFELCQPSIDCFENAGKYITIYECRGDETRDMRLSFPSGHASFTGYSLIYCVLYLQKRMTWSGSALFKYSIQFLLVLMTWYSGITGIIDYRNHWSDVVAGFALGITYAIIVAKFVSKLFDRKDSNQELKADVKYDLTENCNEN